MLLFSAILPLALLAGDALAAPAPQAATTTARTRADWRTRVVSSSSTTTARPTTTTSAVRWYLAPTSTATRAPTTSSTSRPAATSSTSSSTASSSSTTLSTSTTTTSTTTSVAPAATSGVSRKKGLGYNDNALLQNFKISWQYNWGQYPAGTVKAGVEFVPMLWNDNAGDWFVNAQKAIDSGSTHLLGFNEPDLGEQANMDVARAVTAWKTYMSPFYGKAKLVSPAVTNGGDPMGINWLERFRDACPECWAQIDAVALHWYDASWNYSYFYDYMYSANARLGKKLWLTEFAGSGTSAEQQSFLGNVIPWLESIDFIERYAGFGAFVGNYVNADGSLTPLGQVYSNTI